MSPDPLFLLVPIALMAVFGSYLRQRVRPAEGEALFVRRRRFRISVERSPTWLLRGVETAERFPLLEASLVFERTGETAVA